MDRDVVKGTKFFLFSLASFALLSGCQNTSSKKDYHRLRIASQWEISTLHPHLAGIDINCRTLQKCLFEGLTRIDPEGIPQLAGANHVEISEDQTHFLFFLKPMIWSNKRKVTAYDFEKSWKAALHPSSPCPRADLMYILKNAQRAKEGTLPLDTVGVKALDETRLEISLEHPAPYLLDLLANPLFSPIAEEDLQRDQPTLFNGPFLVKEWKAGCHLSLKRNPDYWEENLPHLEEVIIYIIKEPHTALALYEKGAIDWLGRPFVYLPTEAIPLWKTKPDFNQKTVAGVHWLSLNTEIPLLSSAKIRKALSYAVPREEIASNVMSGMVPTKTVSPVSFALLDQALTREENPQALFEEGLEELNLTREILSPLVINCCDIVSYKRIAELLQQVWQESFAIKVRIETTDGNSFIDRLSNGNYQIGGLVWYSDFNDPIYNLAFFKERSHSFNTTAWEDPDYKNYLLLAENEPDTKTRLKYLEQAEQCLLTHMPVIPLYCDRFQYLLKEGIDHFVISSLGVVDFKWVVIN